jgi:hypothetical protein
MSIISNNAVSFDWASLKEMGSTPIEALNYLFRDQFNLNTLSDSEKLRLMRVYVGNSDQLLSAHLATESGLLNDDIVAMWLGHKTETRPSVVNDTHKAFAYLYNYTPENPAVSSQSKSARRVYSTALMAEQPKEGRQSTPQEDGVQRAQTGEYTRTRSKWEPDEDTGRRPASEDSWHCAVKAHTSAIAEAARQSQQNIERMSSGPLTKSVKRLAVSNGGIMSIGRKFVTMVKKLGITGMDTKAQQDDLFIKCKMTHNPCKQFLDSVGHTVSKNHTSGIQQLTAVCLRWLDAHLYNKWDVKALESIIPGSLALRSYAGPGPEPTLIAGFADIRDVLINANVMRAFGCRNYGECQPEGPGGFEHPHGMTGLFAPVVKDQPGKFKMEIRRPDNVSEPFTAKSKTKDVLSLTAEYSEPIIKWALLMIYTITSQTYDDSNFESIDLIESEEHQKRVHLQDHLAREQSFHKLTARH